MPRSFSVQRWPRPSSISVRDAARRVVDEQRPGHERGCGACASAAVDALPQHARDDAVHRAAVEREAREHHRANGDAVPIADRLSRRRRRRMPPAPACAEPPVPPRARGGAAARRGAGARRGAAARRSCCAEEVLSGSGCRRCRRRCRRRCPGRPGHAGGDAAGAARQAADVLRGVDGLAGQPAGAVVVAVEGAAELAFALAGCSPRRAGRRRGAARERRRGGGASRAMV